MVVKRFFLLCLYMLIAVCATAQDGDFFLTHYSPTGSRVDNVNFDIIQDQRGVICIANRAGILTFDGKNWDFARTPAALFSLAISDENIIYAGGRNGFGRIDRDSNFELTYISLSSTEPGAKDIFDILIKDARLYAINESHIFVYDLSSSEVFKITPRYSGKLKNLLTLEENVYVNTTNSGLQLVDGTKLKSPRYSSLQDISPQFITSSPNKIDYLIATDNDQLYLFKDKTLRKLSIAKDQYDLAGSSIQNGIWFNDSLAAISTLKGGVYFINPYKGEVKQVVNYQTGLPDNEVYAMAIDKKNGIWAAHAVGLTRISPTFPFKNFNRYRGLQGKMLSVIEHNDRLYVGTSLGAYYLEEIKDYTEVVNQVRTTVPVITKTIRAQEPVKEKRKGVFGFLKKGTQTATTQAESYTSTDTIGERVVFKTEIDRELSAVKYEYKKLPNIDSKTFQFASVEGKLFCGGLDGLFEIRGAQTIPVTRSPVRYFYISAYLKKVFVSTYTDQLKVYDYHTEGYRELGIFGDYKDHVQHIFEDSLHRVWFCSANDIYWVRLNGNDIIEMDEYHMENPYYYETYGTNTGDSVLLINESGIYTVIESAKELVKVKSTTGIDRYLPGSNGTLWIHADQKWSTLIDHGSSDKLNLLSLFKNINYISQPADSDSYWVITDNNDLYKLSSTGEQSLAEGYNLYLRDIKTNSEIIPPSPKLTFDQQNSNLVFEFVQPEYSGVLDIQFSYKLEGLNDQWSEWSSGYNVINFPYLPEGDYKLLVKSRNILGKVSEAQPVKFKIVPPYWKRPWFYALEGLALALVLYISVKLKKLGYRYRLMSRLIALLTLVIIIELIQTVAENEFSSLSSPVLEFIIQVIVAIIILPVEGLLRKYIFKEVKVSDIIKIKTKQVKPKPK